ncbi:MAG: hypothetical protein JW751_24395 [Polyangiaceae bacterium]|nr:hypothetical protein [Polyangiaceae bacterium]
MTSDSVAPDVVWTGSHFLVGWCVPAVFQPADHEPNAVRAMHLGYGP